MNSLWKDLLILHGHLVRKEDLSWASDTRPDADRDESGAKKARSTALKCCMAAVVWPRLAAPR
ncbi:MAG: hypothetical protein B7X33_06260 [Lysobacterales bacterium 13-68-4]|jgi:hypothetical protein|nr:MAG: hypothetical protein B7X33_06260 [Xanthomonadales bacterium 13-68-4]OZB62041.1 MAG: hypothetical protein B7X45_00790 [Xanthomonadales bacterium 15-68-25]OZB67719.1 MAG: hypothetical protein B7X39_04010 [Xanthomonadales bacterium 14-68-21]